MKLRFRPHPCVSAAPGQLGRYVAIGFDEMFSMNRKVLLIIFPALLFTCNGCKALMNSSSSSFFSNFSLEELVKKDQSPSGMACAKGGMGGGGVRSSAVGGKQSTSNKSSSFSCQISAAAFDEAAFLASLKADVEKEIILRGAKIIKQGNSDPAGFYFEYSEGDINGRISIGGKRGPNYYSLEANLDEKREARGK